MRRLALPVTSFAWPSSGRLPSRPVPGRPRRGADRDRSGSCSPLRSNGFHCPSGCASRSAIAYSTVGLWPSPQWLPSTSMFSARGPSRSRQPCQATMPSLRLKIAVAGTGGGVFIRSRPGQSSTLRSLARSYSCHALLARGAPANGLPSVITQRTWSGARRAISRAKTPPRLQPTRLTLRPESPEQGREPVLHLLLGAGARAVVGAELPAVRVPALVGEEASQRPRRRVVRRQTRQHEHRVAVAARRHAQQRIGREERAQLPDRAQLEKQQLARRRRVGVGGSWSRQLPVVAIRPHARRWRR